MSRDMRNGGIDETGCNFITEKQAKTLRTGFAKDGDVLLSHKGTIGAVSILSTKREFIVLTPQITFYRIKNKEILTKQFLYYYFLSSGFQNEINSIAQGGSTRAYIGITKQLELKLVFAPYKEQQTIVQKLDALSAETKRLEAIYNQKINDLEELKKSVLQKAFSGYLSKSN
jgi:type I restriction enzyme S subunit